MSVTETCFFLEGATEFTVTETIIFPFFFVNKQPIFLSQRPYFLQVTFGNSFFTQKAV